MRRSPAVRPSPPSAPRAVLNSPRGIRIPLLRDTTSELRKIVWPTREEAIRLTALVVAVSVAVGVALGLVDMAFAKLMNLLLSGG